MDNLKISEVLTSAKIKETMFSEYGVFTICLLHPVLIICLSLFVSFVFEQDGDEIPSRRLEREKMRSLPELVL